MSTTPIETSPANGQRDDAMGALREQATDLKQNLRDVGRLTRDVAREQVEATGKAARHAVDECKSMATSSARAVDEYTRRKPYVALAAALGIGVLLGWRLHR